MLFIGGLVKYRAAASLRMKFNWNQPIRAIVTTRAGCVNSVQPISSGVGCLMPGALLTCIVYKPCPERLVFDAMRVRLGLLHSEEIGKRMIAAQWD